MWSILQFFIKVTLNLCLKMCPNMSLDTYKYPLNATLGMVHSYN